MPTCVVFDVGGVILDWHTCFSAVAEYLHISNHDFQPAFEKYLPGLEVGEFTIVDGFTKILDELKLSADPAEMAKIWNDHHYIINPTSKLIAQLKPYFKLGICTNNWPDNQQNLYPRFPIFKEFSFIIESSVINERKPDLPIYYAVEKEANASGQDIYFIDDNQINLLTASKLGWQTFNFQGDQDAQIISQLLLNSK